MRVPLPLNPHELDAFTAAAIDEQRRRHLDRVAADEGYRAVTEEWAQRWANRQEDALVTYLPSRTHDADLPGVLLDEPGELKHLEIPMIWDPPHRIGLRPQEIINMALARLSDHQRGKQ